jgi:alkylresorcinol/alkylpyrone synthase
MIFAIHPGGPKILNHIRDKLGLEEYQVKHSRDVLFKHGNMSSATIPHIWKSLIDDDDIKHGQTVITMAFGPGLTATGFILEVVKE